MGGLCARRCALDARAAPPAPGLLTYLLTHLPTYLPTCLPTDLGALSTRGAASSFCMCRATQGAEPATFTSLFSSWDLYHTLTIERQVTALTYLLTDLPTYRLTDLPTYLLTHLLTYLPTYLTIERQLASSYPTPSPVVEWPMAPAEVAEIFGRAPSRAALGLDGLGDGKTELAVWQVSK